MQRVRFRDPAGSVRTGEWTGDGVSFAGRDYDLDEVNLLPPTEPTKIVCIGLNYADHAEEAGMEVPDRPMLFLKGPNALAGHGDTITFHDPEKRWDYEAELAVVIDEQAHDVPASEAMEYVAGFTASNDLSNRHDQDAEQNWIRGKAFDNAAPLGPTLATPDEVPDDARIRSIVNGEVRQDSSRAEFIFTVPELIEEITTYLTLEPGDVIMTGTPAGIGPLDDGDAVEIDIEGIPTLENEVRFP